MPKKSGKTHARKPKRKQGKRTRKQNKKQAAATPESLPIEEPSYLASTNADTDFVVVNKSDDDNAVVKNGDDPSKIVVGKIYAKWCGHCQSMSDDWDSLENKVDKKVYIVLNTEEEQLPGRVDEINEIYLKDSPEKLTASGYPTIYRIENKQLKYYGGDRTTDAMYDWFVNKKGGENTKKNAEKVVEKDAAKPEKKGWFSWW
jgi:thiol-disulfide isomerase/thioredoxin